jgi:hypothetical protein
LDTPLHEFIQQDACEARLIVARDIPSLQEISRNVAQPHLGQFPERGIDRLGALDFVPLPHSLRYGRPIDHYEVKEPGLRMFVDRPHMIGDRVMLGFAGLSHQIGNVDSRGSCVRD